MAKPSSEETAGTQDNTEVLAIKKRKARMLQVGYGFRLLSYGVLRRVKLQRCKHRDGVDHDERLPPPRKDFCGSEKPDMLTNQSTGITSSRVSRSSTSIPTPSARRSTPTPPKMGLRIR